MIINGNDNTNPDTKIIKFIKKPDQSPLEIEILNMAELTQILTTGIEKMLIEHNVITALNTDAQDRDTEALFAIISGMIYSYMAKHAVNDVSESLYFNLFDTVNTIWQLGAANEYLKSLDDIDDFEEIT